MLGERLGFDADTLGPAFIEAVVSRAVRESGAIDGATWRREIESGGSAWRQLVDLAVVTETWLFRDAGAYEHLARFAAQRHATERARPLRILSCPCSTGEEPYSVAITLFEAGLLPIDFVIDAVDVSARAVAKAEQGTLSRHALRGDAGAPTGYLDSAAPGEWVVRPQVRNQVRFYVGNLVSGEGLPAAGPYDVILCRNLLIYLLPSARAAALQRLAAVLAPDGVLIVGHAEASIAVKAGFSAHGRPEWFAFDAPGAVPPSRIFAPPPTLVRPVRRAADATKHVPPPMPPAAPRTAAAPSLEHVRARADAGDTADALADCERYLAESPQSVAGHVLLAALHAASGDLGAAESSLRRALYLDQDSLEALTHLAAIRADRGDHAGAARLRSRVERLLSTREGIQA